MLNELHGGSYACSGKPEHTQPNFVQLGVLGPQLCFSIESISYCAFQDYSYLPHAFDWQKERYGVMSAGLSAPAFGECSEQAMEVAEVGAVNVYWAEVFRAQCRWKQT